VHFCVGERRRGKAGGKAEDNALREVKSLYERFGIKQLRG
jgi:hypothetical protein